MSNRISKYLADDEGGVITECAIGTAISCLEDEYLRQQVLENARTCLGLLLDQNAHANAGYLELLQAQLTEIDESLEVHERDRSKQQREPVVGLLLQRRGEIVVEIDGLGEVLPKIRYYGMLIDKLTDAA